MAKSNSVGTTLKVGTVAIGGLTSISGIEISADSIDVTDLANTSGFREKLPGFKDGGEIGCSGFLDGEDEGQNKCMELMNSGEVVDCEIVFPAKIGKSWKFKAGVTKFSTSASLEDAVTFDVSLLVSGKPTLAATTT